VGRRVPFSRAQFESSIFKNLFFPRNSVFDRVHPPGGRASDFFSQGLRQHVLIEREVGDEPLQSTVFLFHLSEPPQFTHALMGVLLFPGVEGLLGDPELATEVAATGVPLSA
jgi:hypothetical protein